MSQNVIQVSGFFMSENCAARFVGFATLIVVMDCFIGLLPSVFRAWIDFVSFATLIVVLECFIGLLLRRNNILIGRYFVGKGFGLVSA